ncbi:MAG: hypothetical protein OEX19_11065 [Gammaproteobacteria bacterium]|nr:hypothetical protein [Gammaproteobacteria bacterium]
MNMKRLSILITLCLSANYTSASEVTDEQINTFVSGEAAIAEEVNQNFTTLKDGINDNNSRIGVLEAVDTQGTIDSAVSTHAASSEAHHSRYTSGEAVSAMGNIADDNTLNHDRYTNSEAVAAIKESGVGEITDSLITTQFTSEKKTVNLPITENTKTVSTHNMPATGPMTSLEIAVKVTTVDVSKLQITLEDPAFTIHTLYSGDSTGTSLDLLFDAAANPPPGSDLSSWLDQSSEGAWVLSVIDSGGGPGGEITEWSVTAKGFSDTTATVNGDLTVKGNIRVETGGPVVQISKMNFHRSGNIIYYTAADGTRDSLNLSNRTVGIKSPLGLIGYHPFGNDGGSGNSTTDDGAVLLFNIESSRSIACTVLSREDDAPANSKGLYWATDDANTEVNATVWGKKGVNTLMVAKDHPTLGGDNGFVLTNYEEHSIICF